MNNKRNKKSLPHGKVCNALGQHLMAEEEAKSRRVTLEFKTKAERDEWMKWYARDGSNNFWGWLATFGPNWYKTKIGLKWRKVAERRIKNWPNDNERFV